MKREEILFYITTDIIHIYLKNANKEYLEKIDTSLFFKLGEISDVDRCSEAITKLTSKMNFGLYYLKPNVYVLYNDVCSCDIKFLYRSSLQALGYNRLNFVPLTRLTSKIHEKKNLVVRDGNYYILIDRGEKRMSLESLDFDPIIIGEANDHHVHYADRDILWKTFKTYFTNKKSYDIMDVGDDD